MVCKIGSLRARQSRKPLQAALYEASSTNVKLGHNMATHCSPEAPEVPFILNQSSEVPQPLPEVCLADMVDLGTPGTAEPRNILQQRGVADSMVGIRLEGCMGIVGYFGLDGDLIIH